MRDFGRCVFFAAAVAAAAASEKNKSGHLAASAEDVQYIVCSSFEKYLTHLFPVFGGFSRCCIFSRYAFCPGTTSYRRVV